MIVFAFLTPKILELLNLSSSSEGYVPNWWVSIFFMENYKMIFSDSFPNTSPLRVMWSLCVEEHFYIIWGLSIYFLKRKNVPFLIIGAILLANISRILFFTNGLPFLDLLTNFDYFAFGAIPALLLVNSEEKLLNKIKEIPLRLKYIALALSITYITLSPTSILHIRFLLTQLFMESFFARLFS
ncbi:hypothetical protein EG849_05515 [Flavobacterium macacae]|uniref:Acyltransferase 3 domain-containing protein n=2 Tax=Flavobacterium macacae TaxID=2488993 RepID=A0A3P3WD10_9FLAO|nr:hypothetical protein EG849_05515 [Flavobacterium macacae]